MGAHHVEEGLDRTGSRAAWRYGAHASKLIVSSKQERWGIARAPDMGILMLGPIVMRFGTGRRSEYLPKIIACEHVVPGLFGRTPVPDSPTGRPPSLTEIICHQRFQDLDLPEPTR
jgi:hypothetical protein